MCVKLPITAIITGKNEAHFLDRCLSSINFCDEIIYTDIQSVDNSKAIAAKYTDFILDSDPIPGCEFAQSLMIRKAKHDWVIFIDPDEYIDSSLASQLISLYPQISNDPKVGAVMVPWRFYFNGKILEGTVWGNNKKYILVNRNRFSIEPIAHYGRYLNSGFESYEIDLESDNILHHDWMPTYSIFFKKHMRYLKNEGRDRYNLGKRISFKQLIISPLKEFQKSFIHFKGYKDGLLGLFLSVFWAFYQSWANFSLYLITKKSEFNR
ncbi:glycosyltransferase [Pontibacter sp. CAU 1760]